jgi:hypothetical protein
VLMVLEGAAEAEDKGVPIEVGMVEMVSSS